MRWKGHNVLAVAVAALAMYAIGALIYGFIFQAQWSQWTGIAGPTPGQEWRMAIGPIMPLLQAAGLSLVLRWRAEPGAQIGLETGFLMALFFVFASNLYGLAYLNHAPGVAAIDALHLFSINMVGGAIIGAWR